MTTGGVWTYTLNNSNAAVEALNVSGTLTDTFTVTTVDGTAQIVTVTINGTNDNPVITAASTDATGAVTALPNSGGPQPALAASYLTAGHNLINGLGGPAGFGENVLPANDDGSTGAISLVSVFGPAGIDFFGHNYTSLYINNNGNLTFSAPLGSYTPSSITAGIGGPIIAPFWADVWTLGPNAGTSPGGNSTGSDLVWWNLDSANGVMTITWDDVAYYYNGNFPNAFQVQLINEGNGNFDIVYRYESIKIG